ncbi:hypothetical protein MPTK1_5g16590 [Marchantia polymorpha subsp. ruderalis]|uniref:Uncharacterized protein n=2 Tax=Marchantia polymorpha TaxID=3197 RepID=A0AAF6BJ06_MARPO|nr:hypothetical protein MARPO_0117s0047 [Marchantia polymorpha]BBN11990.1 hypothetical protein Mp_5g16590 [Marchantia polymorpha subsp. ruderalis]|eukprot:PTQ30993.1 hypothetical protein MARPO_0117s0047 [Marchantia polymorpha]
MTTDKPDIREKSVHSILTNWAFELRWSSRDEVEFRLVSLLEHLSSLAVTGPAKPSLSKWSLGIMDGGIGALGRALQQQPFPELRQLTVCNCRLIGEKGMAELARSIGTGNLNNLEVLKFQSNHFIGDTGAKVLADALQSGKLASLRRIDLLDNGIGDEGLSAIALALGSGNVPKLTSLRVGSEAEAFHMKGGQALARMIQSENLPFLEDLRFRGCVVEEGVIAVIKALETRTVGALKKLDLRYCGIGLEGAILLARALSLPCFSSLRLLDLGDSVL